MRNVCAKIFKRTDVIDYRAFADNLFAEFPSVDAAVDAAFSIHRHFEKNPIVLTNKRDLFGVCIGIGYGRVLRSEHEGVYGDEMNLAAKLGEDTAKRGETLLTRSAVQAITTPGAMSISETHIHISGVELSVYNIRPR